MCYVTATELKNNLSHYMALSEKEDVYVTKNNRILTVLTNPKTRALEDFLSFAKDNGLPKEETKAEKEIIGEEILERCGF